MATSRQSMSVNTYESSSIGAAASKQQYGGECACSSSGGMTKTLGSGRDDGESGVRPGCGVSGLDGRTAAISKEKE